MSIPNILGVPGGLGPMSAAAALPATIYMLDLREDALPWTPPINYTIRNGSSQKTRRKKNRRKL